MGNSENQFSAIVLILNSFINLVFLMTLIDGGVVMHNIVISEDACPKRKSVRNLPYGVIYCLLPGSFMIMSFRINFRFPAG